MGNAIYKQVVWYCACAVAGPYVN